MIVCSCAGITSADIRAAITWMRAADPTAIVTPGKVYRALGRSPECGGCMRLFVNNMRAELSADLPPDLRDMRRGRKSGEGP
ncbi:(2Fe-2S)-binding protein [Pikeienuella piscinae]|uniref:(2Fe-2S)-binding protein n=1 Tax=Pikeienuella piscinae TaxID=2748098 RepID=A0A7L5C1Y5_9RHOB|nr:(2Fe-2S)-binding protein [Pikeienuella piscinae]